MTFNTYLEDGGTNDSDNDDERNCVPLSNKQS